MFIFFITDMVSTNLCKGNIIIIKKYEFKLIQTKIFLILYKSNLIAA